MIIRLFFNKIGSEPTPKGKEWVLMTPRGFFYAPRVEVRVKCETVAKPKKRRWPRYFMRCRGSLFFSGKMIVIIEEDTILDQSFQGAPLRPTLHHDFKGK